MMLNCIKIIEKKYCKIYSHLNKGIKVVNMSKHLGSSFYNVGKSRRRLTVMAKSMSRL